MAKEVRVTDAARKARDVAATLERAGETAVRIDRARPEELDDLGRPHQGVAALVRLPRPLSEQALSDRHRFGADSLAVVLDGIEDPQNVGAAARAALAAGAKVLVLRERRAAGITAGAVRASAGALLALPVARVPNITRAVRRLQETGFFVVGLDGGATATIYDEPCPDGPVAFVVGSEGQGLSRLVAESCDLLIRLPMRGEVESLNAAAALAAALWGYVLPRRAVM
jgi:23S rRNA (guanosine2251-2'-O)-methyltransferase